MTLSLVGATLTENTSGSPDGATMAADRLFALISAPYPLSSISGWTTLGLDTEATSGYPNQFGCFTRIATGSDTIIGSASWRIAIATYRPGTTLTANTGNGPRVAPNSAMPTPPITGAPIVAGWISNAACGGFTSVTSGFTLDSFIVGGFSWAAWAHSLTGGVSLTPAMAVASGGLAGYAEAMALTGAGGLSMLV